jgi:acetyl-CoA acetyltransferase
VVRQALARAGWSNGDFGRIEINEAFEATAFAVIVGRPPDIVNG